MLKLGWTYNLLKNDAQALDWFRLARLSDDADLAREADKAYRNLRVRQSAPVKTSAWMFPFYSSRWKDLFTYAQVKTEYRPSRIPMRLYVSTRFSADTRGNSLIRKFPPPHWDCPKARRFPPWGPLGSLGAGRRFGARLAGLQLSAFTESWP